MLFSECKKVNPNSHLIDSAEEIDSSLLTGASSIGVCGATSTPKWLMEEISKGHSITTYRTISHRFETTN